VPARPCSVVDVADAPAGLPAADRHRRRLPATGFHGSWTASDAGDAAVLAVDIPSGVDGATGAPGRRPAGGPDG
jgi:hypothetical protein